MAKRKREQIMGIDVPWTADDEAALEGAFADPETVTVRKRGYGHVSATDLAVAILDTFVLTLRHNDGEVTDG
jgi:hypothetical protein